MSRRALAAAVLLIALGMLGAAATLDVDAAYDDDYDSAEVFGSFGENLKG
jgi:hypothetical protein